MPPIGTPITTEQAVRGVLRMLNTPLVPTRVIEGDIPDALSHLNNATATYNSLSGGEKVLVDIATTLWTGRKQAGINACGSLGPHDRRRIISMLAYRYLGRDVPLEFDDTTFAEAFGPPR